MAGGGCLPVNYCSNDSICRISSTAGGQKCVINMVARTTDLFFES